jgi:hypothetical protein
VGSPDSHLRRHGLSLSKGSGGSVAASTTTPAAETPPRVRTRGPAPPCARKEPSRFACSCHVSHAWSRWMEWTADAAPTQRTHVTWRPDPTTRALVPPCYQSSEASYQSKKSSEAEKLKSTMLGDLYLYSLSLLFFPCLIYII